MKYIKSIWIILLACVATSGIAQQNIGIGTTAPDSSAVLDITSTNRGILIPRMSVTDRQNINNPALGLMVFDSTNNAFYYFNGIGWLEMLAGSVKVLADTDNDTGIQVEESNDDDVIRFDVQGMEVAAFDGQTFHMESPGNSLMIGRDAGISDDGGDNKNVFIGPYSGSNNTHGADNTALGYSSFNFNLDGDKNTAIGNNALSLNLTGSNNTAVGENAMPDNTVGDDNVAVGSEGLVRNSSGSKNVAVGTAALDENINGNFNTAIGYHANVDGYSLNNATAIGANAVVAQDSSIVLGSAAKVGIGTSAPQESLHVVGSIRMQNGQEQAGYVITSDSAGTMQWEQRGIEDLNEVLTLGNDAGGQDIINAGRVIADTLGLGTADPEYMLTLDGGTNETYVLMSENGTATADHLLFQITPGGGDSTLRVGYLTGNFGSTNGFAIGNGREAPLRFRTHNQERMRITSNGQVGIGKQNPSSALDVNGTVKANAFVGDGSGLTRLVLADIDGDTKIQVEESADEDLIRFDIGGTEYFRMGMGRLEVLNSGQSVFIGQNAGENDDLTNNENVFVGYEAGRNNTTGRYNTAVGKQALLSPETGTHNTALGAFALTAADSAKYNTAIGVSALGQHVAGDRNTSIGAYSLGLLTTGNSNVAIGFSALDYVATEVVENVAVGAYAGESADGSGNVFIGYRVGRNLNQSNRLMIDNHQTLSPLIYGEMDNDLLRINGTLNINNAYSFPTTDGNVAQILANDGAGNLVWVDQETPTLLTTIKDADNDTKIQVEESPDEDVIRMDVAGREILTISSDTIIKFKGDNRNLLTLEAGNSTSESGIAFKNVGSSLLWSIHRTQATGNFADFVISGGNATANPDNLFERFRIARTGNVAIGTDTVSAKLNVGGNINIPAGSGLLNMHSPSLNYLKFDANNNAELAAADSINLKIGGQKIIGIKPDNININAANLTLKNSAGDVSMFTLEGQTGLGTVTESWSMRTRENVGAPGDYVLLFSHNGSDRFYVTEDGDLRFGPKSNANKDYAIGYDRATAMASARVNANGTLSGVATSSVLIDTTYTTGTGRYTIVFKQNTFSAQPIVTATAYHNQSNVNRYPVIESITESGGVYTVSMEIRNQSGSLEDAAFNFIAIGERGL